MTCPSEYSCISIMYNVYIDMYIGTMLSPVTNSDGRVHIHKRYIMMCECGCKQTYCVFPSKRSSSKYINHAHRAHANFAGKTLNERYGHERALVIRQRRSKSLRGINHYLHGTTFDAFHGEKAEQLHREYSARLSGRGNPRYGKPVAEKCSRGIAGTYKQMLFRSSYELAFLLHADRCGWFENLVAEPFAIPYNVGSKQRTYWPDYVRTDTRTLYEIKPHKHVLVNVNHFNEKRDAALLFASANGYTYEVVDETLVDNVLSHRQRTRTYISMLNNVALFRTSSGPSRRQ